jgi:nucleoside-diphosphate-sugar epimerase
MSLHVVVGAGPIGSGVAQLLAHSGKRVRVVTRRGTGPRHPAIELLAADATDAAKLGELASGAVAIYNCANPPYHRWPADWPPLHAAMLAAAQASGAVLAITGNLYGYGPVDRPMTEDMPLAATTVKGRVRADMWRQALAAHEAGRVRVTEVRGSDFLGPDARSMVGELMVPVLLKGKAARLPANLDVPHSFTYTGDMARTLVRVATDERAWGRAWHVPTDAPVTIRELADRIRRIAGVPPARLRRMPYWLLWTAGLFSPAIKGFREVRYQFQRPFVLDSTLTRETFGLEPTPLDEVIRTIVSEQRAPVRQAQR